MLLIVIAVLLVLISIFVGRRDAEGMKIHLFMNKFTHWRFNFGASFKEFRAKGETTGKIIMIEILTIGLVFFDIEVEFFKDVPDGEELND